MQDSQSKPRLLNRLVWWAIALAGVAQVLLSLARMDYGWYADVFVSFAPYIVIACSLVLCAVVIIELKNYKNIWLNLGILLVFGLIVFNSQPVSNWIYGNGQPSVKTDLSHETIKLASFNKLVVNRDIDTIRTAIKDYDVVAISEITKKDYKEISRDWKYSAISDCQCDPAYGVEIAVFSKYKILGTATLPSHHGYGVALRSDIQISDQDDLVLHAIHPQAPVSEEAFKNRNDMLLNVISPWILADKNKHSILVGDMNLSAYSKSYDRFVNTIKPYRNAGMGYNIWRTWCLGQLPVACAPIDHIFVSNSVSAQAVHVVQIAGSDHMLVAADIMLK